MTEETLAISVAAELSGRVRLGILVLEGLVVHEADEGLAAEIESHAGGLRARYGSLKSSEVPGTQDGRALYKALGIDPTKTRPSNEALLRRVLKGESLYHVNTLVDALNLCSLRSQLPFGLYDLDRIAPPVELRRGRPGESYEGIRKGPVNVEGRPTLADTQGAFGNPTSDSARTCITLSATRALVTAYAPAGFATSRLLTVLGETGATLMRFCGGRALEERIL